MIKVIKTDNEYQEALAQLETLVDLDPKPNTPEFDLIEILSLVIGEYESNNFVFDAPDPVDAILFRMEQQGLTPRDLIPYLGSRSKVSEILNRSRPLTLTMIRALHSGLGLPASILIKETVAEVEEEQIDWARFPLKEMVKRGYITASSEDVRSNAEGLLREWLHGVGIRKPTASFALFRRSVNVRSERTMDGYALAAWTTRVIEKAQADKITAPFQRELITLNFMHSVAKLSVEKDGPLLARGLLREHGIDLIIEPHLPRTHLDGAAIKVDVYDHPVIGLSLRHDRLDNFWFCLMHELAHISLHLDDNTQFYDDLDLVEQNDSQEREADELAGEALIPEKAWRTSPASVIAMPDAAQELAQQLGISPSIVAGRMRHEFKAYRLFNNLVGHGEVRRLFPYIEWPK